MLRIRLRRVGRKHDPSYQVIVAEKGRGPQTGDYVEKVGTYDARSDEYDLKDERVSYWLSEGAQPTDTVHNLLAKAGIIDADTVNPLPQKSPVTAEEPGEESSDTDTPEEPESSTEESSDDSETDDKDEADNEQDKEEVDDDDEEQGEEKDSAGE